MNGIFNSYEYIIHNPLKKPYLSQPIFYIKTSFIVHFILYFMFVMIHKA